MQPLYDPEAVRPMFEELEHVGVRSLHTPEEVDEVLNEKEGTTLVIVNSVCGCAAGGARPGVTKALQHKTIPDRYVTVFAGVDRAAVEQARGYMTGVMPSSPAIALFKDGELVHMLERHHIERMDANAVAFNLSAAFDKFCSKQGPSVSPEVYAKLQPEQQCGSSIPLYNVT